MVQQPDTCGKKSELHQEESDVERMITKDFQLTRNEVLGHFACVSSCVFFNMDWQKEQREERGGPAAVTGNYEARARVLTLWTQQKQTRTGKGVQRQEDRPVKMDLNISTFQSQEQRLMSIEMKFLYVLLSI